MRATDRRSLIRGALAAFLACVGTVAVLILLRDESQLPRAVQAGVLEAGLYVYDRDERELRAIAELSWPVGSGSPTNRLYAWNGNALVFRDIDYATGRTKITQASPASGAASTVDVGRLTFDLAVLPGGDVIVQTRAGTLPSDPDGWARLHGRAASPA
jgi:hypothetical protein